MYRDCTDLLDEYDKAMFLDLAGSKEARLLRNESMNIWTVDTPCPRGRFSMARISQWWSIGKMDKIIGDRWIIAERTRKRFS